MTLRRAGPFAILIAGVLWLVTHWDELPGRMPVHWNWRLQPDSQLARAPLAAALPLLLGFAVCLLMAGLQAGLRRSIPPSVQRESTLDVLLASEYLIAVVCCGMLAASATNGRLLKPVLFVSFGAVLALLFFAFRVARRVSPEQPRNPAAWRAGVFCVDRTDPALFVPKRSGYGYTFNFGNPIAVLITLATLVLPLAIALGIWLTARGS
ncbi:MAG TPA: DUF5808 domain-containing protein [Myxococcales bacterium]|nr:DUF5808 domain-containing protein [Myxococcales bacterium]